jgi:ABC-type glycerol-3-phosphate transport system permease component
VIVPISRPALPGLIPTLVVFLIFQRTLTRGITAGAVE